MQAKDRRFTSDEARDHVEVEDEWDLSARGSRRFYLCLQLVCAFDIQHIITGLFVIVYSVKSIE